MTGLGTTLAGVGGQFGGEPFRAYRRQSTRHR